MPCCDLRDRSSISKPLVRFVGVCQKEQVPSFDQRQIPIHLDDHLIIKLEFDDVRQHYQSDSNGPNYQTFINAYEKLSSEELAEILTVSVRQVKESVLRYVPCIGCRTSIDNFLKALLEHRYPALEPFILNEKNCFTVTSPVLSDGNSLYYLFYIYGAQLDLFIESIPKSRKNRRCPIHSLEKCRSIKDWEIVWDLMNKECRDEVTLVETDSLLDTLENYLHKHKFCSECKLRVLEAYDLLLDDHDRKKYERKGFCPALYEGLRSCSNNKHIHIQAKRDFVSNLISRAEPEIQGSRRERHAKSLDIAQEEILTCLGIYLFERFDKIYRIMKSEEQAWQYLYYITVDCFRMNFERAIDRQRDLSVTLEILCEEFYRNDQLKLSKKKRPKRKTRSIGKTTDSIDEEGDSCHCSERSNSISTLSSISSMKCEDESRSVSCETLCPTSEDPHPTTSINEAAPISCDECSLSCLRCSSIRTDPGYSSGHEETCPLELCECSTNICDQCSPDGNENVLNSLSPQRDLSEITSNPSSNAELRNTIELCDVNRKHKLKLELSTQYPFFNMDFKQIWDENIPNAMEKDSFISDDDLHRFFTVNSQIEVKRAQLRDTLKSKFHAWQQQTIFRMPVHI